MPWVLMVSLSFIKMSLPYSLPTILHILDTSLQQSYFPSLWKESIIRPIPKISSPLVPKDYRPISLLCSLSKVLERVVHRQISSYLEENGLCNPLQSGFRSHHSTQTALLKVSEDMRWAMDRGRVTLLVLFDFSRAFDCVDHALLMDKLVKFNFSSSVLRWLASYLAGRWQRVSGSSGELSGRLPVSAGVPQGSVLGPLLFSLFISDVSDCLDGCNYHLYADDLQIYLSFCPNEVESAVGVVNKNVRAICDWARENKLRINPEKTRALLIGGPTYIERLLQADSPRVKVNGIEIGYSRSAANLGVIFDSSLKWKDQINATSRRVFWGLHRLIKIRHLIPVTTRAHLINSLIMPLFDYCCLVCGDVSGMRAARLDVVMNSCVRFIFDVPRHAHITPYYAQLGWLRASQRRLCVLGRFIFKLFTTSQPQYIISMFTFRSSIHNRVLRGDGRLIHIPTHRTEIAQRSFVVGSARLWNTLPSHIRKSRSLSSFHSLLKVHLLGRGLGDGVTG